MRPYHVTYLNAQSQNEFIELIGHEVQRRIVQEIKDAGMYSVMADTTPDVSHKDRLAIACRYVDKMGLPRERLVSLTEAVDKTREGGATEIIGSLTKQGLNLDELCFQSYDYTASMSGRFNGVQKKLQDKLGKSVPYIPCLTHRSNTVIEHSCKASPIITELFNVLEALYVFYTGRTKRMSSLEDSIQSMKVDDPLNLRNLSRTRWTARAESIKSVWICYEAILDSLSNLEQSDDGTASGLRSKLLRFDCIVSIMFMKNIMYTTKRMTETLQSEDLNVIDAITIVQSTVTNLQNVNDNIDGMNKEIQAAASFAEKLGVDVGTDFLRYHRQRKPSRRIDDNPSTTANLNVESFYRKEFKAVLDTQINTFTDVLENCVATIKPLFQALQPGQEPSSIQTFEALAKFHPDKDRPDPDALMSEIETFKLHLKTTHEEDAKDISSAAKKAEEMKLVFPLTNRAFRLVLTAPVTVAKDERTFSKLKTVKNLCRSRTSDERLEELMFMACEKDITDEIPVQNLATLWASLKSRRITIGPV
ncbi:zinc finger MYM-type 1-like [Paramuricea clavata]|uniref:Zinc finger MYM-type 1-like n=1 Tax=Paramuricea clavata TaxID=317549 RepID=A0A6S7GPF2_PARCT|nr:zinc finger MYM-type 1-like [Paramuricea clavata]